MGSFICRQPNGLLCRFSTVTDTVTHYNMTDEEYIQMYIQKRITTARAEAEDIIKNHLKPFEWIDDYFVDNNMTEEEFEQIKAKMYEPKGDNKQSRCNNCIYNNTEELSGECYRCVKGIEDWYVPITKQEEVKDDSTRETAER